MSHHNRCSCCILWQSKQIQTKWGLQWHNITLNLQHLGALLPDPHRCTEPLPGPSWGASIPQTPSSPVTPSCHCILDKSLRASALDLPQRPTHVFHHHHSPNCRHLAKDNKPQVQQNAILSASSQGRRGRPIYCGVYTLPQILYCSIVVRTLVSAGELSLSCAQTASWMSDYLVVKPSAMGQPTWPTQPSIPQGPVDE